MISPIKPKSEGMSEKKNVFPKARRSASADSALRAEIRRLGKLTMEQRMSAALSMGKRLSGSGKVERHPGDVR